MERQFRNSCQLGQIEIVKDLISQGVDVKSKDQLGRDGLFWAAERGQVEIVKLLMSLDKPGNVNGNQADDHAHTPLHVAVLKNHKDVVTVLLQNKDIDIDLVNFKGQTALDFAKYQDGPVN